MTATKAIIHRLHTGVPGLDEVLGGGLPEFSFNLIAGSPGSGKTTLAHQMMFALATPEHPALYFTVLGEPPLKMLRYQQQFDFFDREKINHAVHFINLAEETASGDLKRVLARIVAEVETHGPALIFVDSFRSVILAGQDANRTFISLQEFVQQLGMLLTSWQATTFLLGEYFSEKDPSPIFTVGDGLIWLHRSVQGNSMVRKVEIMKMRGQPSLPGLHTFRINAAGVHVYPSQPLVIPDPSKSAWPIEHRLRMGVPGLDEMLGGGLPRGYSMLVAGPSGSGKSILAAAFLAEGARGGETGVLAAFEQRTPRSRGHVIADFIASGQISVVDTRQRDLSVAEIATQVIAEVRRIKATRVVIDSLSSFEISLAPTFQDTFRDSMTHLVAALAETGATVVMTSELEDRYDDLRFSPYGTAFMTDAILVQRYIEVDSRLQRMIAVVKVRSSAHSNELRLFHIDKDGIKIDERLDDYEGLLGGRPTRRSDRGGTPHDASDE